MFLLSLSLSSILVFQSFQHCTVAFFVLLLLFLSPLIVGYLWLTSAMCGNFGRFWFWIFFCISGHCMHDRRIIIHPNETFKTNIFFSRHWYIGINLSAKIQHFKKSKVTRHCLSWLTLPISLKIASHLRIFWSQSSPIQSIT